MSNKIETKITSPLNALEKPPVHISESHRILKIFLGRKLAVVGLAFILLMVISAIFAPWLAPYPPDQMDLINQLLQPSGEHPLGTDSMGRDTLSRVIYGARTSLLIGFTAVIVSTIIGEAMGLVAAHFGGWVYTVIMRLTDALMSIPMMIIALVIATMLGSGIKNVIIALAVGGLAGQCRMMCAMALSIKQNDYITAVRSMGSGDIRMMLRHVLPNAFPPLLVMITINLGMVILAEAALSFLGIGIVPPMCAWGSMVNDGYKYLLTNPVLSFAPGLAIMVVVFGFNMMGDGLRDSLDPKLRGTL
jgi:peptide/nickel transport system permease protein